MSFVVVVYGALKFGRGGVDAWRAAIADPGEYGDWGDFEGENAKPRSVEKLREGWGKLKGRDFVELAIDGDAVEVRGHLNEELYREECLQIAAAFRLAEAYGGQGELVFDGLGDATSWKIGVRRGRSSLAPMRGEGGLDPRAQEVLEIATGRVPGLVRARRANEKWRTKERARSAAVDDAKGRGADARALDVLFRTLRPKDARDAQSTARWRAESALFAAKGGGVGVRALEELGKALALGALTRSSLDAKNLHHVAHVRSLFAILGRHRHAPALPVLLDTWERHRLPLVRNAAGEGLLRFADAAALRTATGKTHAALFQTHDTIYEPTLETYVAKLLAATGWAKSKKR